ncbi:abortive infection family protein [Acinetobacter nosocomialis]|uniref:abortive infection family protein n=1 Tax=Acinetobacter nosocomialis TaxID=106654 RepID=UPI001AEBA314|nr:abortive infection family protein [Acinetobacter nosocomialis]MBP1471412.1 abortive infection family protein [Acinetobacter nosocomialis]
MSKEIPAPVIAVLADHLPDLETHDSLNNLFLYANAPGEPPEGSKPTKTLAWLRRINKESPEPLITLGKLIEGYMEIPEQEEGIFPDFASHDPKVVFKEKLESVLTQYNMAYIIGGIISDGRSISSKSLSELIKGRDIPAIEAEFTRALKNINSEPREAVSAACNILESIFKVYITDENLPEPSKQDLQNVWKIVRADLGFDPNLVQDDDLKRILSGILSVVDGIGAFRTHASSAHGQGRKLYNIKPRHARLAIHSAHTLALFILETWDEKRAKKS